VGVAYSDQLTATGGTPPYLWDNSSGTPPAGLILSRGTKGGTSAIARAGFSAGAAGTTGVTESDWAAGYRKFLGNPPASNAGQGLFVKMFYHLGLPADWASTSGTGAPAIDIANAFPGVFPTICWNNTPSASGSEITAFCNSIPAGQQCGFAWQQEQENGGISSSFFQSNWKIIYNAVRASKNSANMFVTPASVAFKYTSTSFGTGFLPPPSLVDAYCVDAYYHLGSPPATGLQDFGFFQNWLTIVQKLNGGARPLGLTEYGIDTFSLGNSAAAQATRARYLQNDIAWINAQFGNPSGVSPAPLFCWMYWDRWTKAPAGPEYGPLTDATAISLWGGAIKSAGGGGSGSSGGLLSGTPTTAGTTSATYRVTDANNVTATKSLSCTIAAANTLVVSTQSPLPGATVGVAYSTALQASGGTPPYSWAVTTGSPPTGVSLSSAGLLSGTPTVAGTSSATYQVTDSASPTPLTASASLSITVSGGLAITTTSLPGGTDGVAYTATLVATGGTAPYNWSIISSTGLPDGLTLDPAAGVISGTPTGTSASFTIQVTDSANATATQQLAISITGGPSTGGVGRRRFGGGISDWTFTSGTFGGTLVNPMTSANDLIVGGASGLPGRLAAGADWQVLGITGAGAVAWQNAPVDWQNIVIRYGADPTGVADSTAAFAAARTAAKAAGGLDVYIPAGTYTVNTAQLSACTGLHLIGAGWEITTINCTAGGSYFMNLDPSDYSGSNVEDFQMTGLTVNATGMDIFWGSNIERCRITGNRLIQNSAGNAIMNVSISTGSLGTTLMQESVFGNQEYVGGTTRTIPAWNLDFSGAGGQACNDCLWDYAGYKIFSSGQSGITATNGDTSQYWWRLKGAAAGSFGSRGNRVQHCVFELRNGTGGLIQAQNIYHLTLDGIKSEDLGANTVGNPLVQMGTVSGGTDGSHNVVIRNYARRGGSAVSNSVPDIKLDQYSNQVTIDSPGQSSGGAALIVDYQGALNVAKTGAWPPSYTELNTTGALPVRAGFKPSDPASTVSTTLVTMGLGSTCAFTPGATGKVLVTVAGVFTTATGSVNMTIAGRYGTGTAPANGAADTGTAFGSSAAPSFHPPGTAVNGAFTVTGLITGLTVGTAYWLDLSVKTSNASDAASVSNLSVTVVELL
jgi:hypothetical protein